MTSLVFGVLTSGNRSPWSVTGGQAVAANAYYGRLIGSLESPIHELRGDVYAVDARTLFIKGFSYNGYEDQGSLNKFKTSSLLYSTTAIFLD